LKKVDAAILKALQKLGYSEIKFKYNKIYARRNRDHLILKLSKKGTLGHKLKAHQDFPVDTPPYHRIDVTNEKRLLKELRHAYYEEKKRDLG